MATIAPGLMTGIDSVRLTAVPVNKIIDIHVAFAQLEGMEGEDNPVPQLPLETFDSITAHLERPSDLLALALVCKELSAIILTRHIKYRDVALVQLDANDEIIWNDLLHHPDRTANVRRLELRLRGCCPGLDGRTFIPSFTDIVTMMQRLSYLKVVEPSESSDIVVHSWELCWKQLKLHNYLITLEVSIGQMMLSSSRSLGFVQVRISLFHFKWSRSIAHIA